MQSLSDQQNHKPKQECTDDTKHKSSMPVLMLGALGVVFGDIGTSPLYALKESFVRTGMDVTPENIYPFLSMIFWLMLIVVSVKYVTFVMRSSNKGEGGILALLALVLRLTRPNPRLCYIMGLIGVMSAGLFYADAAITPAISVLSAMEGIEVIAPAFHGFILPVTIVILIGLFSVQKHGTGKVGKFFGPVVIVWFLVLAVLGIYGICGAPEILQAVNPLYALKFIFTHPLLSFIALGATVLCVTGAESIYTDMGHFGLKPIRYVWFCMVWPCLVLNYFGQGALLIRNPAAIENPFYLLAPNMMLVPLLLLATMATVIASQAVISGTSSLTRQAIQLGYLPRMRILYTSAKEMGQIYIPFVNWSVLILVLAMVLLFRTSSNLAGAYGVALSVDFLITSLMLLCVMRLKWRWRWLFIAPLMGLFLVVDTTLVMSAATKIPYGGYIPLVIGIILFTLMTTWKRGQRILNTKMSGTSVSVEKFINEIYKDPPLRVSGTAIYMIPWHNTIPSALLNNLKHNKVLHERIIFLTVVSKEVPYVAPEDRVNVYQLGQDFYQLDLHTGFKDEPNVPSALHQCLARGMDFDHLHQASFFFSKETVIPRNGDEMATWREHIFVSMKQNASSAVDYYRIPTDRVIELGGQYEI